MLLREGRWSSVRRNRGAPDRARRIAADPEWRRFRERFPGTRVIGALGLLGTRQTSMPSEIRPGTRDMAGRVLAFERR